MIRNYLTIALRNIRRQPGYSALNILGLTLGIAATLFILLYITEESRFDTQHLKGDRIYRIGSDITEPDDHFRWSSTQLPLAPHLKNEFPEVEEYTRLVPNQRERFQHGDHFFNIEETYMADSTVFDVFTFDMKYGEAGALDEPNTMILSESASKTIFGDRNPIGETLTTAGGNDYEVTGVYTDWPHHSHVIPEVLFSIYSRPDLRNPNPGSWGGFWLYSYVLLQEGTDSKAFEQKLSQVIEQHVDPIFSRFEISVKYETLALKDIHLHSTFEGEPQPVGNVGFLYIFGAVALFMLMIACINYMNLSTARATKRAMEVGVRKVLGSERRQLIGQFLSESVLFTSAALIMSFVLVHFLLPVFNATFDVSLGGDLLWSKPVLLGALGILLLAGFLGGSYPAFYLSGFKPIDVLKGTMAKGTGNPKLRRALVTFQFAITIFMIIGTGIIYDQMNYLRNKDLGFEKENILRFELPGQSGQEKFPIIQNSFLENPKITAVGSATTSPGDGYGKNLITVEDGEGVLDQYGVDMYGVDYDYFPTLGIDFVEGRNFSYEYGTDTSEAVIVNEAMVERMGWGDEPLGRRIQFDREDSNHFHLVIGVVKNFHQNSLYEPITALLFYPREDNRVVHAKIAPSNAAELKETIAYAENQWQSVFPNTPFEYDFVDEAFMELYEADQIRARIFTLFSVLMIFVACLGLFGLASFTAEQRTKEIGVRRVLGAGTSDIIYLLTRNFMLMVSLATLPAFVAAWYFMSKWLDTFSFHTNMNYLLYGLAFLMVALIALGTTGYHALRASRYDPVKALRTE